MKVSAEEQFQEITRGLDDIISKPDLLTKLKRSVETGKPLVIKAGFDPTAPDLHLGHTVVLQKMALFQSFGHQIVFLIGDFTGLVGDPSGKTKTRPQLTREQVNANAETYKKQVFKILDSKKTLVKFNSEWLDKLDAYGFVRLAAKANVARMLEREDFKTRYKEGQSISVHEFLYPLLQAYDSVALKADVEMGGRDQIFNLLLGRELMRDYGLEPQICLTVPLLEGLDGIQKMSKSAGNYVGIDDAPNDIYGKIMSLPDTLMRKYYDLLSRRTTAEIDALFAKMKEGLNPKEVKSALGVELTARFHSPEAAEGAKDAFQKVFADKGVPEDIPEHKVKAGEVWLPALLKDLGLVASTSEGKRLVPQGGVKLDGAALSQEKHVFTAGTYVLQCGKRKFVRLIVG
ncbi:tyrosine--tRNA ligase [bacterium]|nr:tyrosine--tRNA ligase [bacterium]